MNTSDLYVVLCSNLFKFFLILCKLWYSNVDWSSQSSSQVGWARSNVTQMVIMWEFNNLFNMSASSWESFKDLMEICTLLHRDDSQLIFFIDPYKESLVIVVENSSSFWPVSVQTASFKESISLSIIKYIINIFFELGNTYLKRKWSSISLVWVSLSIP